VVILEFNEKLNICAMYLACKYTNLFGIIVPYPRNKKGIIDAYNILNKEYQDTISVGLGGDKRYFYKRLQRGLHLNEIKFIWNKL